MRWVVLWMYPGHGNKVADGARYNVLADAIERARCLNTAESYQGRYFVVPEEELPLFGIPLPPARDFFL